MKVTVSKMSIVIDGKHLWTFLDEAGGTRFQILSKEYPQEMLNYLNKNYIMLLSDKLFKLGSDANPNNNLSQTIQGKQMLNLLIIAQNDGEDHGRLVNITKLVIKELNKAGFSNYDFDSFYETKTNK